MDADTCLLLNDEQLKYLKDTLEIEKLALEHTIDDPRADPRVADSLPMWREELEMCNSILELI